MIDPKVCPQCRDQDNKHCMTCRGTELICSLCWKPSAGQNVPADEACVCSADDLRDADGNQLNPNDY